MTEEVNSTSATHALNSSPTSTEDRVNMGRDRKPGVGQNTRQIKIHSSRGVLRNISM